MGRKKGKEVLLVAGFISSLVVVASATSFFYNGKMNDQKVEYEAKITEVNETVAANYKTLYVTTKPVKIGDILEEGVNVTTRPAFSDQNASLFLSAEDIGGQALLNIPEGTQLLKSMVTAFDPADLRERECAFIRLNSNSADNDFVDIRISYLNGEDRIIVAKTQLKNVDLPNNDVFLWLTEAEILRLDGAIYDASVHQGAFIYITKYVEPNVQDASIITYTPNADVIKLIKSNPNVLKSAEKQLSEETRKALEDRLKAFADKYPEVASVDVKGSNSTVSGTAPADGSVADEPVTDTSGPGVIDLSEMSKNNNKEIDLSTDATPTPEVSDGEEDPTDNVEFEGVYEEE